MNAILFIALIVGGTALLSWPLGRYMKWAMDPDVSRGGLAGKFDRLFHFFGGRFTGEAAELEAIHRLDARVQRAHVRRELRHHGAAAAFAAQPGRQRRDQGRLIFNTAASFTSNTNLQHYSGESRSVISRNCAL